MRFHKTRLDRRRGLRRVEPRDLNVSSPKHRDLTCVRHSGTRSHFGRIGNLYVDQVACTNRQGRALAPTRKVDSNMPKGKQENFTRRIGYLPSYVFSSTIFGRS